jgi:hypothetical protein
MDLALDTDGDIDVSGMELHLVEDGEAIEQHAEFRLRFVKGEYFLDETLGTPYFQEILIKNPDLVAVRSILRRVVAETPGVVSVDVFELTVDTATRIASVYWEATADSGQTITYDREFRL